MDTSPAAALARIAEALESIAVAIEHLGTNNASTGMGAIELLAKEVKEGFESISNNNSFR